MIKTLPQPTPADGIATIQYSLRCFNFALASALPSIGLPVALLIAANADNPIRALAFAFVGLIPVISLPMAWLAASNHRRARAASKGRWNPAHGYLAWGRALSALGVFISLLVILFFVCVLTGIIPWRSGETSRGMTGGE